MKAAKEMSDNELLDRISNLEETILKLKAEIMACKEEKKRRTKVDYRGPIDNH